MYFCCGLLDIFWCLGKDLLKFVVGEEDECCVEYDLGEEIDFEE